MKHLILILLTALTLPVRADYDTDAAERKSDWYFMEALRQKALGHDAMYYSMMGRAADLSPDSADRSVYERSIQDMYIANVLGDSIGMMTALGKCEAYFDANPTDTYAGSYLARINAELGRTKRTLAIYDILERQKPNDIGIVANHAEYLMRIERLDEAIGLYRTLEKTMGRSPQLTQRLANIRAWQGDTLGALAEVDSLIAAFPRSTDPLHLGAVAAGALGLPERVLTYTDRAIALDPSDGAAYYYAANAYKELGRMEEYETAVRGALLGDDLDISDKIEHLRYYVTEKYKQEGTEEDILHIFETLVTQYPQEYDLRKLYFGYLMAKQRPDEAIEQLEHAINIDSSDLNDYAILASLYASEEKFDEALAAADAAIAKNPADVDYYELKANIYTTMAREAEAGRLPSMGAREAGYAMAAVVLNTALQIDGLTDSEQSEIYGTLGDLAQHESEIGSPAEYYEKALELNRTNHLAMNNYAYWLSNSKGDLMKAKELISKALLYMPDQATYLDTMAWVCYRLGQIDEAKRYIDKAIAAELSEELEAELLQHAGDIYNRAGDKAKAKEYWQRAKEIDPEITSE